MANTITLALIDPKFTYFETTATAAADVTSAATMAHVGFSYTTEVMPSSANGGATVILEGSLTTSTGAPGFWATIHSITVSTAGGGFGATTTGKPFRNIRHNTSAFVSSGAAHLTIRTYAIPN